MSPAPDTSTRQERSGRSGAGSLTEPTEGRPGLGARVMGGWRKQRAQRPWLNHLVRAASHYGSRQADLLAAGITYFGFLALFPVILLAVSIVGFVLSGQPDLLRDLIQQIRVAIPGDLGQQVVDGVLKVTEQRGVVGVVGLIGFLYAGLGWMGKLRVAMQTIWRGKPDQPNFAKDYVRDLLSLIGLGGAILTSVILTALATGLTSFVIDLLGLSGIPGIGVITALLGIVIAVAGDTLIFLWLFTRLPRMDLPVRQVLPGAVFGAVGFEILKLIGTLYISQVSNGPAAAAGFGSLIGLLVWIYITSRFLLFAAAWTSTSPGIVDRIIAEAAAEEPSEPVVEGPQVRPLKRPAEGGPSTSAVAAGLVGVGALVGALAPRAVRRWWRNTGRRPAGVGRGDGSDASSRRARRGA